LFRLRAQQQHQSKAAPIDSPKMLDDTYASTDTEDVATLQRATRRLQNQTQPERDAVRAHELQVLKAQLDLEYARRPSMLGANNQEAETTADNNAFTRQAALDFLQSFPLAWVAQKDTDSCTTDEDTMSEELDLYSEGEDEDSWDMRLDLEPKMVGTSV
jgi:hypothetical protein